ncbi:MAG TPA: type IV toxin-antitoxin system AbiEi family antitoxin [Bryobacteraceae bacterium]|jgi:hypothetical protein|nr:type IV toxin-antitoxin system AbiEi family antitoxin [Bryobacteraceae bacterium]
MTTQQERILDTAMAALGRTAGINARVHPVTIGRHGAADAIIEVETDRYKHRFGAEVKTVDRFATPAMLKAQGQALHDPPLLVAPYITREVAEHCRQLRLPFIDTAGNAYLEAAGLLVYVVGQARPVEPRQGNFRALNPAGLKLTFALLCRPGLLDDNYRNIATAAGVALGTVGADMKDLQARGFFNLETHPHLRKLLDPKRMLEEWVTHYPITLRPKLTLGRFRADPERLQHTALAPLNAYWGGEPAAEKLTRYLKPAHFTIYTGEPIAKLVAAGRMRAEPAGNVEILEKFWKFPAAQADKNDAPDVVPPILAYADLLATNDGRNAEAARMIYEQRIEPAFDTTE